MRALWLTLIAFWLMGHGPATAAGRTKNGGEPVTAMPRGITSLAVSADGRYVVASCSVFAEEPAQVRVIEAATKKELHNWPLAKGRIKKVAISPDARTVAAGCVRSENTGDNDWRIVGGDIYLWDMASGELQRKLSFDGRLHGLEFTADGAAIVTASDSNSPEPKTATDAGNLQTVAGTTPGGRALGVAFDTWELASGRKLHHYAISSIFSRVALAPGGRAACISSALRIAGNRSESLLRFIDILGERVAHTGIISEPHSVMDLAYSDDGRTVLAAGGLPETTGERYHDRFANGSVWFWDTGTGTLVRRLDCFKRLVVHAELTKGTLVAAENRGRSIQLRDAVSGELQHEAPAGGVGDYNACITNKGAGLIAGSSDGMVRAWMIDNLPTALTPMRLLESEVQPSVARYFSDNRRLAVGGSLGVEIWDVPAQKRLKLLSLGVRQEEVFSLSLAVAADGNSVAAAFTRRAGEPLNPETANGRVVVWDSATGKVQNQFEIGSSGISYVVLAPASTTLAICHSNPMISRVQVRNGFIELWDVASGKLVKTLETQGVYFHTAAFSPDGRTLACSAAGKGIYQYDLAKGIMGPVWATRSDIHAMAFTPDGQTLVCGNQTNWQYWDVAQGKLKTQVEADAAELPVPKVPGSYTETMNQATVMSIADDGTVLAAESAIAVPVEVSERNGRIVFGYSSIAWRGKPRMQRLAVWDATDGRLLGRVEGVRDIHKIMAFAPDGKTLVAGYGDGTLRVWNIEALQAGQEQ